MRLLRSIKPRHRTLIGGLVIGTAVTLLMLLVLQGLSVFSNAELSLYDWQFRHRGPVAHPDNIVVVGVDEGSIGALPYGANPVRRYWIGQAVKFLASSGVKAIGIDYSYFNPSIYDHYTRGADSGALAAALKTFPRSVVNQELEGTQGPVNFQTTAADAVGLTLLTPIDPIIKYVRLGLDNVPLDPDGEIRRALNQWTAPKFDGTNAVQNYPTFPVQIVSAATHRTVAQVLAGLPQNMRINYSGYQAIDNTAEIWPTVGLSSIADTSGLSKSQIRTLQSDFRGKIAIIVSDATSGNDVKSTPFGDMYGGYVQANTIETLLQRNPIIPAGDGINNLVILLIGLLATVIASRFGIWHSVIVVAAIAIGYPIVTIIAFSGYRYWLNLAIPELTLLFVLAAIMAFRFATEERQKRRAHQKFGLYLKPEIVDIIVNSPDEDTTLEGVRRPISVLFVDIRGFTAMSERMNPEDVVRLLDIYLEELTESVQQFDGTLDKYVGDELMGVWNAPRVQADHPMLAVKSALDMVNRLDKINVQLTSLHLPNIKYGIGVNSGEGIVGEMGSTFRKQYDAIGDTVNTAARLCSAAGGAEIIIGQPTWEVLGDRLEVEETEPLSLKGKSAKLRTFRVIAVRDTPLVAADVVEAAATTA
jgi:adenylate cyclase